MGELKKCNWLRVALVLREFCVVGVSGEVDWVGEHVRSFYTFIWHLRNSTMVSYFMQH